MDFDKLKKEIIESSVDQMISDYERAFVGAQDALEYIFNELSSRHKNQRGLIIQISSLPQIFNNAVLILVRRELEKHGFTLTDYPNGEFSFVSITWDDLPELKEIHQSLWG